MDRWNGKVAVVTGASSGIGAATVIELANAGMRVVGFARRVERVEALKKKLSADATGEVYAFKCDVTSETDIKGGFEWIEKRFGAVNILINNAGVTSRCNIVDPDNTAELRSVIDTNLIGVALCTREAFRLMQKHNIDGHIMIINSVVGHSVPFFGAPISVYPASKYGVTAMTEVLRQEMQLFNSKTKITVNDI